MDNDSAVRRLDKTGRLVIPKRMRRAPALAKRRSDRPGRCTLRVLCCCTATRSCRRCAHWPPGTRTPFMRPAPSPLPCATANTYLVSRGFGLPNGAPLSAAVQRMLTACMSRGVW